MDHESKAARLTPYELERMPQPLPPADQLIQVTGRFLESELSCAICLGLLKNTRTTKECLHRFCADCISQALRSGNKECPNCRKKLASMRSLRPDPVFDELIKVIFPDRDEIEDRERQILEKLSTQNNRKALVSSIEEGKRYQAEKRKTGGRQKSRQMEESDSVSEAAGPSFSASNSETGSVIGGPRCSSDVTEATSDNSEISKVFLEIVPNEMRISGPTKSYAKKWKRRLVKVRSSTNVAHLSHFILLRLLTEGSQGPDAEAIDVSKIRLELRKSDSNMIHLDPSWTLSDIQERHWRVPRHMLIAFTITGKLKNK